MHGATCTVQHARCNMHGATCTVQHAWRRTARRSPEDFWMSPVIGAYHGAVLLRAHNGWERQFDCSPSLHRGL
eukprot:365829-Chlamydomonas_euryale.AAC.4